MSSESRAMHRLMPSEVARLVLGYLREAKCEKSAETFLHESRHLYEYRLGLEEGYEYPTNINGKNLQQFLHEPVQSKISSSSTPKKVCQPSVPSDVSQELQKLATEQANKLQESESKLKELTSKIDELMGEIKTLKNTSSTVTHISPSNAVNTVNNNKSQTSTTPENDIFKTPVKQIRPRGYLLSNSQNNTHVTNSSNSSPNACRSRHTPRKTPTPKKYSQSKVSSDSSVNLTSDSTLDVTLTPRKVSAIDTTVPVDHFIYEELMNNPTAQETFAQVANQVLNCLNSSTSQVNTLTNGPIAGLPDACQSSYKHTDQQHSSNVTSNCDARVTESQIKVTQVTYPTETSKAHEQVNSGVNLALNDVNSHQLTHNMQDDPITQMLAEIMETESFNNLVAGISSKVVDQQINHPDHHSLTSHHPPTFSFSEAFDSSPFADSPNPATPSSSLASESDDIRSTVSSTGSLETPKSVYSSSKNRSLSQRYSPKGNFSNLAVKNLFDDLKTPEKKKKKNDADVTAAAPAAAGQVVSSIVCNTTASWVACNTANETTTTTVISPVISSSSSSENAPSTLINGAPAAHPSSQQQQQQQQQSSQSTAATASVNQTAIQVMTAATSVDPCYNPIVLTLNPGHIVSPHFLQITPTLVPPVTSTSSSFSPNIASQFIRIAPKGSDGLTDVNNTNGMVIKRNTTDTSNTSLGRIESQVPVKGKRMSFDNIRLAIKKAKTTAAVTKDSSSTTAAAPAGRGEANKPTKTIIVAAPPSKFKDLKSMMDKLSDDKKIDDFLKSKVHNK